VAVLLLSMPLAAQASPNLDGVRAALAKYKDPVAALGDGYLLDPRVHAVSPRSTESGHMAMPAGGMGVQLPSMPA